MTKLRILPNIRIRKIILNDFRNICHAEVDIPGGKISEYLNGDSSILGLYGQNGSGKTSLVMAISALKCALSGSRFIYADYASCIRAGCESCKLEFEFSAYSDKEIKYDLYYSFKMAIDVSDVEIQNHFELINSALEAYGLKDAVNEKGKAELAKQFGPKNKKIKIYDEILQVGSQAADGKKSNKQIVIDTTDNACNASGKVFGNKRKYEQLTKNCEAGIDSILLKAKIEAEIKSTSFIFSSKVINKLVSGSEIATYKIVLRALKNFGINKLFAITMYMNATNSFNTMIVSVSSYLDDDGPYGFTFPLELNQSNACRIDFYPDLRRIIGSISSVISNIVPGLSIEIEETGKSRSEDGQDVIMYDMVSVRSGTRIPLAYESDGIRRIISFLSILTAVYNDPSVTLAIDEIDSGIFEYMLGELLAIMNESAKGQLIFTSHNLRPLEVLPYKNLLFTTINPENRFTKLDGISGNNNLRDSYFRSIILGSGKDAFYDATDTFSIEQAFYEAGLPQE